MRGDGVPSTLVHETPAFTSLSTPGVTAPPTQTFATGAQLDPHPLCACTVVAMKYQLVVLANVKLVRYCECVWPGWFQSNSIFPLVWHISAILFPAVPGSPVAHMDPQRLNGVATSYRTTSTTENDPLPCMAAGAFAGV